MKLKELVTEKIKENSTLPIASEERRNKMQTILQKAAVCNFEFIKKNINSL